MDEWFNCYEGSRDGLFTRESMRHPAKMAVNLCFKIFEHGERMGYWKKGDVVLDPMCGIFTTGICGAIMGYRVVGVELEQHFFTLAQQNIEFARPKFHSKGDCEILQGDARYLSELLRPNGIVSSPPYLDQRMASAVCFNARKLFREGKVSEALDVLREQERREIEAGWARAPRSDEHLLQRLKDDATDGYNAAVVSPPYADQQITQDSHFRSAREPNRPDAARNGRARYSAAVTSPPFLAAQTGGGIAKKGYEAVVTSPPFTKPEGGKGEASNRFKHNDTDPVGDRTYQPRTHGTSSGQIGNLRDPKGDIGAVLSSPPYADQMSAARARGRGPRAGTIIAEKKIEHNKMGDGKEQIANLADETYLGAMLQVYRELYRVLRPFGVVALVTKNPVKKGQIRRLDLDTIKLMQASGFILLEHKKAMLAEETFHGHLFEGETRTKRERKSFFKRLFEKKNPHLAVDFEDVLYFRKANAQD